MLNVLNLVCSSSWTLYQKKYVPWLEEQWNLRCCNPASWLYTFLVVCRDTIGRSFWQWTFLKLSQFRKTRHREAPIKVTNSPILQCTTTSITNFSFHRSLSIQSFRSRCKLRIERTNACDGCWSITYASLHD